MTPEVYEYVVVNGRTTVRIGPSRDEWVVSGGLMRSIPLGFDRAAPVAAQLARGLEEARGLRELAGIVEERTERELRECTGP